MRDICGLLWFALFGLLRSRASLQAEALTVASTTQRAATEGSGETGIPERRPVHIVGAVSCVAECGGRPHHREAGDGDWLASGGFSSLVALEIKATRRPAEGGA